MMGTALLLMQSPFLRIFKILQRYVAFLVEFGQSDHSRNPNIVEIVPPVEVKKKKEKGKKGGTNDARRPSRDSEADPNQSRASQSSAANAKEERLINQLVSFWNALRCSLK